MPKPNDPLDELPILEPGSRTVRADSVPPLKTFKRAVAKLTTLRGKAKGGGAGRTGGPRGGHPRRGRQAAAVRPSPTNSRRVVVKGRYVKQTTGRGAKAARLHVKYVERDGVDKDGGKGVLYNETQDGISSEDFLKKSADDPHQFRFIISPEEGADLDLTRYTRDLMDQVQADLGRKLDWVAVNHYNTDDPHTHVVIRGRGLDGEELRIDSEYIKNGFRCRARELATRELGPRMEHEIEAGLRKEIGQERFTSLDAQIARVSHENLLPAGDRTYSVALRAPGEVIPAKLDRYVVGRLNVLKQMGLASQGADARSYELHSGWKEQLRDLGERGDIYKRLSKISKDARQKRIFDPQSEEGVVVGRLSGKGSHDELYDRYYAVVEDRAGTARYVHLPQSVDVSALPKGSIVRIQSVADPYRKLADAVLEDFATSHAGVYDRDAHANELAGSAKFMKRGIDPQDYALAHARRAERLVRFGLAKKVGDGRYQLPVDLEARQEALERDKPNARSVRVDVLDARPISTQEAARGPTWLDSQTRDDTLSRSGFGEELSSAITRRAEFIESLGIGPNDPNRLQRLGQLERLELANRYSGDTGKSQQELKAGEMRTGTLVSKITGASGKSFGVFESEREFSLVPWRQRWDRELGKRMSFGMDARGVPFAQSLGRGLKR